jgi:hypothetical protein
MTLSPADIASFTFDENGERRQGVRIALCDMDAARDTFLVAVDVLVMGLVKLFGDGVGTVELANVDEARFRQCAEMMKRSLDIHPVAERASEAGHANVSGRVAHLSRVRDELQSGGDLSEYGVHVRLGAGAVGDREPGTYIVRFLRNESHA